MGHRKIIVRRVLLFVVVLQADLAIAETPRQTQPAGSQPPSAEQWVPDALVKMFAARQLLDTGEFSAKREYAADTPFAGRRDTLAVAFCADGTKCNVLPGLPGSSGIDNDEVALQLYQRELRTLELASGTAWDYRYPSMQANVRDDSAAELRACWGRELGLFCVPSFGTGLADVILSAAQPAAARDWVFETSRSASIHEVSLIRDSTRFTWWIDADRGWNPIRMRATEADGRWQEVKSELRNFDGQWFPAKLTWIKSDEPGADQPATVQSLSVDSVVFNAPSHAHRFTPEAIGIQPGINITRFDRNMEPVGSVWFYDGHGLIDSNEFARRVHDGSLEIGPDIASIRAQAKALLEAYPERAARSVLERTRLQAPSIDDEWERLVREFCAKYSCDGGQRERAFQILADCRERAHALLRTRQPEISRLQQVLFDWQKNPSGLALSKIVELQHRFAELVLPALQVRDEVLIPRLNRLLTKQQRAIDQP